MKNTFSRRGIVRYIVTYFMCLLLAVLTWLLVTYSEISDQPNTEGTVSASAEIDVLSDTTVL